MPGPQLYFLGPILHYFTNRLGLVRFSGGHLGLVPA